MKHDNKNDNMYNVLEEVTRERYPVIEEIEKIMMENDALVSKHNYFS